MVGIVGETKEELGLGIGAKAEIKCEMVNER